MQCLVTAEGDDVEKEAEIEKKQEGEADYDQTKKSKAGIVDFREEQIQQLQPLVKAMDDPEGCQQPEDSGYPQLTETDIAGKDGHAQREESKAIEQIKDEIPKHQLQETLRFVLMSFVELVIECPLPFLNGS